MSKTKKTENVPEETPEINEDQTDEAQAEGENQESEVKEEEKSPELSAEDEALNTKYMRLAADFQNYKRRVEKEKSDIYAYANEKIAIDLLDVMDNFERALAHNDGTGDDGYAKGMELIFKQLLDLLKKNEIEEIVCLGEEFDPNMHHAVMMEDSDKYESGKVCEVLKKGYKLRDKVIRPSMVKVVQ